MTPTCIAVQEVQLYTADVDHTALTMGLRTPTMSPASQSPKLPGNSHDKETRSATMTHCSASSFHAPEPMKEVKRDSSTPATKGTKPVGQVHEVSGDSEEDKTSSSVGRDTRSPETSSPPSLGPCGASFTKRQRSGELQSASGGDGPSVKTCISMKGSLHMFLYCVCLLLLSIVTMAQCFGAVLAGSCVVLHATWI